MTTYEEDIVDVYYNLQGYFTMKNVPFSAIEKRNGGKGRGEIDIIAVKVENENIKDVVHAEVSVSVTSQYPFVSNTQPQIDESGKILKKFFRNDSEHQLRKIFGHCKFRRVIVSSKFSNNVIDKLKERISYFGGKVEAIKEENGEIFITINDSNKTIEIEILPFDKLMNKLKELFKAQKLEKKNFQDPRYRALQYLVNSV